MNEKMSDAYYEKLLSETMVFDEDSCCFDINLTDRIVKIKKKTKLGQQYYLFKKLSFEILEDSDKKCLCIILRMIKHM